MYHPRGAWLLASALSLPIYVLAAWRLRPPLFAVAGWPLGVPEARQGVVVAAQLSQVPMLEEELVARAHLFPEFDALYPGKFNNKTNGITPRRWLLQANPELSELITEAIGDGWPRDLEQLRGLVVRQGATPVYLRDVALVEDGFADARSHLFEVTGDELKI